MHNIIIGFILLLSTIFSQDEYCYNEEEIIELQQYIEECEFKIEFTTNLGNVLSLQLNDLKKLDTLNKEVIVELEKQLQFKDQIIKEVKPKWHENKYLWFGYGIVAIIIPTWVLGNVK